MHLILQIHPVLKKNTPGTRVGPGCRNQMVTVKSRKTPENPLPLPCSEKSKSVIKKKEHTYFGLVGYTNKEFQVKIGSW